MGSSMMICILLVWVSKHVLLLGMTCLIMHEIFKRVKWHVLTKYPFLACFAIICAYGLILSTCFPKNFRFRLLKAHLRRFGEGLDILYIQVGRSSLSKGDANILPMEFLGFSKTFMFIPLSLCMTCISLYVAYLPLM